MGGSVGRVTCKAMALNWSFGEVDSEKAVSANKMTKSAVVRNVSSNIGRGGKPAL